MWIRKRIGLIISKFETDIQHNLRMIIEYKSMNCGAWKYTIEFPSIIIILLDRTAAHVEV